MTLSGSPLDYLAAFLGGVLMSFTPCIYPLIPISASYIGISANGSRMRGFLFSLVYVSGIAIVYSLLGLLASLTGTIFGRISAHPATYISVGIIIILFGLSMLELFTIALPGMAKTPVLKKQNYFSVFILGLSSGLVASPCLTPVLGSILAYLATRKNLFYGATLWFSFAWGMGFILILIGISSSLILVSFPKKGKWMLYTKKACAWILIVVGAYFIYSGLRRI